MTACTGNESLLDAGSQELVVETVLKNSSGDQAIINGTFSHRQLGKTDQWVRQAIANSRSGEDLANRDFFNIWTSGTESSPLPIKLNEAIRLSEVDPAYTEITKDNYHLRWYIPRQQIMNHMNSHHHLICLDSSNAVGKDSNGLAIMDIRTMEVIAAANISEANLFKFARWLTELLIRFPKTTFMIENKSSAQGIIDAMLSILPNNGIDPFKRIYNRVVEELETSPQDAQDIALPLNRRPEGIYLKHKGKFGFMTTGNRRAFLYDTVLQQAAATTGHLVRDRVLSEEIRSLVTINGRVDHPSGGHDDVCFAWLLGHYLATHSKSVERYGIDRNEVLSQVSRDGALASEEELVARGARLKLRLEIQELKEQFEVAASPNERMRIEYQLARKVKATEADGGEVISLSAVLEEAKQQKQKRRSLRDVVRSLAA